MGAILLRALNFSWGSELRRRYRVALLSGARSPGAISPIYRCAYLWSLSRATRAQLNMEGADFTDFPTSPEKRGLAKI